MIDHRATELTGAAAACLYAGSIRRLGQLLPAVLMASKRCAVSEFTL